MGLKEMLFRKTIEKKVEGQVKSELGNKSLAYVSRFIRGLIPTAGVAAVRRQVIKSIEDDLKRAIKKNRRNPQEAVDALIQNAVSTPDYMALLKDLDMGEDHLKVLAKEALSQVGNR